MATGGEVSGKERKGLCETCLFSSKETPSTLFCVDCKEFLCHECGTAHRMQRLSRHHKIVDKSDAPPEEVIAQLSALVACPVHKSEDVVYICRDHDQACCSQCANTVHRKCDKLDAIEDLIKSNNGNDREHELVNQMKRLSDFATGMRNHEMNHKKAINDSAVEIDETVAQSCRALSNAVDALQSSIAVKTDQTKTQLLKNVDRNLTLIRELEENISSEMHQRDLVVKHGRKIHTFLLDMRLKQTKLPDLKRKSTNLLEKGDEYILSCSKFTTSEDIIKTIRSSLGVQTVKSESSSNSLQSQTRNLEWHCRHVGTLNLKLAGITETETETCDIMMLNGKFVIFRNNASSMCLFSRDGTCLDKTTDLSECNWGSYFRVNYMNMYQTGNQKMCLTKYADSSFFCWMKFSNIVLVCEKREEKIQVVQPLNLRMSIELLCYEKVKGNIMAISREGQPCYYERENENQNCIYIFDMQGIVVDNIPVTMTDLQLESATGMTVSNGVIVLSFSGEHKVVGIGMEGNVVFTYTHDTLRVPGAPQIGPKGSFFITSTCSVGAKTQFVEPPFETPQVRQKGRMFQTTRPHSSVHRNMDHRGVVLSLERGTGCIHELDTAGRFKRTLLDGKIRVPCLLAFDDKFERMMVLDSDGFVHVYEVDV